MSIVHPKFRSDPNGSLVCGHSGRARGSCSRPVYGGQMSQQPMVMVESSQTEYVVVLRAVSAARFLPGEGCELTLDVPELSLRDIRLRTFTRWTNEGGKELPRELIIEVRGRADSLDEAASKFAVIARPIATLVGFVANVKVGQLEVHIAYDCTPASDTREFAETFLPDDRGLVSEGRPVRKHLLDAVLVAFVTLAVDSSRVGRALRQYELALREWYVGGEWLALNHLWIAAENLTKAIVRKTIVMRGVAEEDLAHEFGLVTDDPKRPRWKELLGARVREEIIFGGDSATYKSAKDASDGIEHGIWELNKVAEHALKVADKTFYCVRRAIIDLLGVIPEVAEELVEIKPTDVQSMRKVARGRLVGSAEDPAAEGELYPRLEWQSGIDSVVREGSAFRATQKERITVRTHPDVGFRLERFEVFGRLSDGQVPVKLTDEDVVIEHSPPNPSITLVASVMPLVDAAVASGAEVGHTQISMFAFNMFGQAVAFYRGIQVLLDARQPVETLPVLRGLGVLAARFEQMSEPGGSGLGIAARTVLDSIDLLGADVELADARRLEIDAAVRSLGVSVPDELDAPESTRIYASLKLEMEFALWATRGAYGVVGFHLRRMDADHAGFHVRLEPGPLTDLVSTAAVIAMLDLLRCAGAIFSWGLPTAEIESLLSEARAVNESAAQLNLFMGGFDAVKKS